MSDDQPLVDAHHHVWDLNVQPQPWLDEPGHEPIRRSFGSHADRRRRRRRRLGGPDVPPRSATYSTTCGSYATSCRASPTGTGSNDRTSSEG
ncbi:hypothetical protein ADL12_23685 [Streptomyces regalis]|uniref:Amidohydrolase-related domain-containing protein n=1 Tax=Streptomyces regalis TaxID=68262 RepID=A0A101JSH8_9ACTN|nr:hypothetical protein ADL12_23685 [Streptomyces regalis]